MATDTAKICSVCNAPDYHRCSCPWDKAFMDWPHDKLRKVKALIGPGPYRGS